MKHYHKNPRTINVKQFSQLKEWLRELGDLSGIVHDLNTDEIIGGNQRMEVFNPLKAQIELTEQLDAPDEQGTVARGFIIWEGKKYTYRAVRWNAKTAEKANIVANKAGGNWDFDVLANQFEFDDLLNWGFSDEELKGLDFGKEEPGEDPGAQVDKAEELREKWQVETGQLWQLDSHRLICGDCTDRAVVERVMGGEKANLIVTDPPYGVDYEGGSGNENKREKLSGDDATDLYPRFLSAWMRVKEDKAAVYIWFAGRKGRDVFCAVEDAGLTVRALLVWNKIDPHYGAFMAQYMQKHEPCLYCVTPPVNWYGPTNEVTVWDIKQPSKNEHHPTEKPAECMERPIRNSSKIGDIVADPFLGSGTTLIACERLNRKCRAVEISPAYVAVALERWAVMTGKTPVLVED